MKKITLQSIAEHCNVSVSLVSRVINGKPGVAPAVRETVQDAIAKLQYRSSAGWGQRKNVAVLFPVTWMLYADHYSNTVLSGIYKALNQNNYLFHGISSEKEVPLYPFFAAISLSGINDLTPFWGERFSIPMITVNTPGDHRENVYSVCSDEDGGVENAVRYLHRRGHHRIGLLTSGSINAYSMQKRIDSFHRTMKQLYLNSDSLQQHGEMGNCLYPALRSLLHQEITALICPGETLSIHIPKLLRDFHYRLPQDLSLLGWEIPEISEVTEPALTTMGQDFIGIGEKIVEILDALQDKNGVAQDKLVPYLFHERESVTDGPFVKMTPAKGASY